VSAHPASAEAELVKGPFRGSDAAQRLVADALPVGDARGEAGLRRRVPDRQAEVARQTAHVLLAEAGFDQRVADAALVRGPHTRPHVAEVVAVRAVDDGVAAALRGDRAHGIQHHAFAHVAAVAPVGDEGRLVEQGHSHPDVGDAELSGQARRRLVFPGDHHRGDDRHGDDVLCPQGASGDGQHDARVDAARRGHAGRAHAAQTVGDEALEWARRRRHQDPVRRPASAMLVIDGALPQTGQADSRLSSISAHVIAAASTFSRRS